MTITSEQPMDEVPYSVVPTSIPLSKNAAGSLFELIPGDEPTIVLDNGENFKTGLFAE